MWPFSLIYGFVTFYAVRWFFLYMPSTRGRTHTFLKVVIGSDTLWVIIGLTRPIVGGCYGMISSTTVAPSAHICVNKSPISRNKVTSPGGTSQGTTARVQFFPKCPNYFWFLNDGMSEVDGAAQNLCGGLPRCAPGAWTFSASSHLLIPID